MGAGGMGASGALASGETVSAGAAAETSAGGASRPVGWTSATRPFEAQPCDTSAAARASKPSITVTASAARRERIGSLIILVILGGPHLQVNLSRYSTAPPWPNSPKSTMGVPGRETPARKSFELAGTEGESSARAGVRASSSERLRPDQSYEGELISFRTASSTTVPLKKSGFIAVCSRAGFENTNSRRSCSVMRPCSTSS